MTIHPKIFAMAISILALAGCRHGDDSELEGGNVNNGPGPVGTMLKCSGKLGSTKATFQIRHTAALTIDQGILSTTSSLNQSTFMYCTKPSQDNKRPHPDAATTLWNCDESREGDGLYHAHVHLQGISSAVLADISLDQMYPLEPKAMGTLLCTKVSK